MPIPVTVTTVDPRPTVVIAQTTSWEEFRSLWPKLLDEVYTFVRACPDFGPGEPGTPRWTNVMLYRDQRPSVEIGVLAPAPFTPAGRVIASALPGWQGGHNGPPRRLQPVGG